MSEWLGSAFGLSCIAAWFTSVIHAVQTSDLVLALVDIFIFPFGIIHGFGLWFGWW